jgi:hypothetical protein
VEKNELPLLARKLMFLEAYLDLRFQNFYCGLSGRKVMYGCRQSC